MDLKELETLAAREMARHGLRGWTFALADTKRRLGACKYKAKRIEVAAYYAEHNPVEAVRDTLMHEIAHALAGPGTGHGPAWKALAVKLGATPRACEKAADVTTSPGDWQAVCPACAKTYHLYRRPRRLDGYRCRCRAKAALTFAYAGDPANAPPAPVVVRRWEATCPGCATVHVRHRRPRPGTWHCRCPQRGALAWKVAAVPLSGGMPVNPSALSRSPTAGRCVGVVGDVYRFLATGDDTNGAYALWEALVPPGGGPPPHVHSREQEAFYVLEGEITFRHGDGQTLVATAGTFAHMPPGVPHAFRNESGRPARMLISVTPAGLEMMFFEVGTPLEEGATAAPPPSHAEIDKLLAAAPRYGIEIRKPT